MGGSRRGGVCSWLGIPYAAAPVGPRRFAAPQPPKAWSGVRAATSFGASAMQTTQLLLPWPVKTAMATRQHSEDCLHLNVWSPAPDGGKRPVLVWVHGGAWILGQSNTYLGHEWASRGDLVVVTMNYRLGAFGVVNLRGLLDDQRLDHNLALRDQLAALEWVRDNIEAFGGDPGRVTIAGESAGAASVTTLMGAPRAQGLFSGVIAQSGTPTLNAEWDPSLVIADDFCTRLGVSRENLEPLWSYSADRLLSAMQETVVAHRERLATRPYWDGDLLAGSFQASVATPPPAVPVLIGSNHDECRLFQLIHQPIMPTTRPRIANGLSRVAGVAKADAILALYPSTPEGFVALGTDVGFTMPTIHLAQRQAQVAPVYRYRLDFRAALLGLGACHAIDIPLLWPVPDKVARVVLGKPTPGLAALRLRMQDHWIAFCRTGAPGPDWPPNRSPDLATKVFDLEDGVLADPERERRIVWDGLDIVVP